MKTRSIESELFHAEGGTDRQTDRHDEANSHFSQLWERPQKFLSVYVYVLFKAAVTNSGRTASM